MHLCHRYIGLFQLLEISVPGTSPALVRLRVWSCVNRPKWQASWRRSKRDPDQRHLHMRPASVLAVCARPTTRWQMQISLPPLLLLLLRSPSRAPPSHFESLCLHNTRPGKRTHLHHSSHKHLTWAASTQLRPTRVLKQGNNKKADPQPTMRNISERVGDKLLRFKLNGQVACEWRTNCQGRGFCE